jgi:RNA polymerase sigma-54 factor
MAMTPKFELRQGQQLVMTPQLQQAIKLLQFTNLELTEYVELEVEKNPLLEHIDPNAPERGDTKESGEASASAESAEGGEGDLANAADGTSDPAVRDAVEMASPETIPAENESPLDVSEGDMYEPDAPDIAPAPDTSSHELGGNLISGSGGSSDFAGNDFGIDQNMAEVLSLADHLQAQLNVDVEDPVDRLIGVHLIDMVDEAGYLGGELANVADMVGCPLEQVEATLARLQTFDPSGVFARDLQECLALQLKELNRYDPAMSLFLDNLELLARHELAKLARICQVDAEDIAEMVGEIKALNPKPGLAFGSEIVQPVVPDVYVRPNPGGGWLVELNSDTLPKVLVNMRYHASISGTAMREEDKAYVTDQLNSANWLVKSLDQRANTILRVGTELVRQQDAFLALGVRHLKPLNLRDIAEVIEMHESTVSRVTANKYLATPRGIYPMKYFFTSSIASSSGGEAHSAESVRDRIRELIDNEKINAILSDDKIVDLLRGQGMDIARRTVAKYREALRIPSSVERRRQKKMQA